MKDFEQYTISTEKLRVSLYQRLRMALNMKH